MSGYKMFTQNPMTNKPPPPPPYEERTARPSTAKIQIDSSRAPNLQTTQPTNINVVLSVGPPRRWPYIIGLIWFLMIFAIGGSVIYFIANPWHNKHFPDDKLQRQAGGSGPIYGMTWSPTQLTGPLKDIADHRELAQVAHSLAR